MRTVYATLGLVFVLLMLNFGNGVNSDAWFLLNHGRYVASFGIPHVEPFTLHEGFHFVMQQWRHKSKHVTPCFPLRENATKWQKGVPRCKPKRYSPLL